MTKLLHRSLDFSAPAFAAMAAWAGVALCAAVMTLPFESRAQLPQAAHDSPAGAAVRTPVVALTGPSTPWADLSAKQRAALQPLQHTWSEIAPEHQQKWLEIAARLGTMPPQAQARIQARMTEWAQMSPQERGRARLRFQEAKGIQSTDRKARWEEFQSLTPEQRHELAERAAIAARNSSAPLAAPGSTPNPGANALPFSAAEAQSRRQLDGSPDHRAAGSLARAEQASKAASARELAHAQHRAVREEAIAPAIVQAKPGVTTTLMSKRTLIQHEHVVTPKIATASDTIDASTLLPRKHVAAHVGAPAHEPEHLPSPPAEAPAVAAPPVAVPPAPSVIPPAMPPGNVPPSMQMPHPEYYK